MKITKRFRKLLLVLAVMLTVSAATGQSMAPIYSVSAANASLSKSKITLGVGQRYTLKASGISKKITWKSSKESVASVNTAGVVTAKKEGITYITAKSGNISLKCKVTVKGDYKALYKKLLAKGSQQYFLVLDINRDGIKELIVSDDPSAMRQEIYTVKNGSIKKLGELFFSGAAVGPVIYYSQSEKAIYHQWLTHGAGGGGTALYKISGNGIKMSRYAWSGYSQGKTVYYIADNKKVSKNTYDTYVKQYFGNRLSKLKQYKMLKNTASNRNKIK